MSINFRESIRVTEEYKKTVMMSILQIMINSVDILSIKQV